MHRTSTLVAITLASLIASAGAQSTLNVPTATYPTIQSALTAAVSGDTVLVSWGFFYEHSLDFGGKSIHLRSSNGALATIIDAQQNGPVIVFDDNEGPGAIVEGFTITNGVGAFGQGGGITIHLASPQILDCQIQNNTSMHGASSFAAGGISIAYGSSSTLVRGCTISNNTCDINTATGFTGGGAGGVTVWSGEPVIRDCRIVGNTSNSVGPAAVGGVLFNGGTTATVDSCLIAANNGGSDTVGTARAGAGGLAMVGGFPRIINSMIARNYGGDATWNTWGPGGIYIGGSSPAAQTYITNCTITRNVGGATVNGATPPGGVLVDTSSAVDITNSILWLNNDETGSPAQIGGAGSPVVNYCVVWGSYAGVGNTDLDPLLTEDAAGYWRLQAGSSCIDAGSPTAPFLPASDFEGDVRSIAGIDIGADELPQPYPGTGEDFRLKSSINTASPNGNAIENATGFDVLHVEFDSPSATFDYAPMLFAASLHPPGAPPFTGIPGIAFDLAAYIAIADGIFCSGFGCPTVLPGGTGYDLLIPPGLAGANVMLQGILLALPGVSVPVNGLFATTDGHEIVIQ